MRLRATRVLLFGLLVISSGLGPLEAGELRIERVFGPEVPTGPYKHPACMTELSNGDLYLVYYGGKGEYATDTAVFGSRRKKGISQWTPPKPIARDEGTPVTEPRIEKRAPSRTARERADAAYQRGVAAHQQGQLDDAAAAYAAALREEPSLAPARQALAGVLIAQGRADDAQAVLVEGVARTPQHTGLALMLARLLAERGELQRAAGVLEAAPVTSASAEEHALYDLYLAALSVLTVLQSQARVLLRGGGVGRPAPNGE